jgi:hypothetical protein
MIAHIYPSVLQAVSGWGYAGCLDGCFQGCRGEAMQDLGYELPRILIPRTPVNKRMLEVGKCSGGYVGAASSDWPGSGMTPS